MHVMCNVRSFKNFATSTQTFKLRSCLNLQIFVSLTIWLALVQSRICLQRSVLTSWLRFTNLLNNFYEMVATVNSEKCNKYRQKIKKNAKKYHTSKKKNLKLILSFMMLKNGQTYTARFLKHVLPFFNNMS